MTLIVRLMMWALCLPLLVTDIVSRIVTLCLRPATSPQVVMYTGRWPGTRSPLGEPTTEQAPAFAAIGACDRSWRHPSAQRLRRKQRGDSDVV